MGNKKYYGIVLFLTFFVMSLSAKKVGVEDAFLVAKSHVAQGESQLRSSRSYDIKLVYTAQENSSLRSSGNQDGTVYYYVFNINENDGFVIVSGDDVSVPVLGYSFKGIYDKDHLPPNFVYWMEYLQNEIGDAIEQKTEQSEETKAQWDAYFQGAPATLRSTTNDYLVQTEWDQYGPYNNLCPEIGNVKTVTGCVATAMAQIMYYYKCPTTTGTGQSEPYNTKTYGIEIPSVDFGATTYRWSDMSLTYPTSGYTDPNDAVATLMYHCGVSVKMDYDLAANGGSGATTNNVGRVLPVNFGYDVSIQAKDRAYYTDQQWHAILENEINAGRPMVYSGRNENSGHAFICDGYDSDGKFHFNWGWGGSHDGYFVTSSLNPGAGGAGSGSGTYNLSQSVIINIMPESGGSKNYEMKLWGDNLYFTATTTSSITASRGESVSVNLPFYNVGITNFVGKAGLAIVNENDEIQSIMLEYDMSLASNSYWSTNTKSATIPTTMTPGDYYIRPVIKGEDETDWNITYGAVGSTDRLLMTIDNAAVITHGMKIINNTFTIEKTIVEQTEPFNVTAQFKNRGTADFSGGLGVALVDGEDNILEIIGTFTTNTSLQANGYFFTTPHQRYCYVSESVLDGNYYVRIVAKPTGEDWSIVYGETASDVDILPLTVQGIGTAIQEAKTEDIRVWMSPSSEYLIISGGEQQILSIRLFDLSGKKVKEYRGNTNYEINLPVTDLPTGVYLLLIQTQDGLVTKKILK